MSIERLAEVVSVENDGKILVRILPEMQELKEDDLPFAYPVLHGNITKSTPYAGETIIVRISEHWTSFSYDGSKPPKLENDKDYPNAVFISKFKEGTTIVIDESNGTSFFKDKSGSEIKTNGSDVSISANGNLNVSSKSDMNLNSNGNINIKVQGAGTIGIENSVQNLKSLLDELIDILSTLKTPGYVISPDDSARLLAVKAKFGLLFK